MRLHNGQHLTYCTNIHTEKNWQGLFTDLKELLPEIKRRVSPEKPFGVGLRLSDHSARELLEDNNLMKFKQWLSENDLYIFTLNGFPYGTFHQATVKDNVHKPDWTTKERVEYSKRLCRILAVLLPDKMDGGISTSPLSYKPWFYDSTINKDKLIKNISDHLSMLVQEMMLIRKDTGKIIHLDIEPEPDGLIENTEETISFFRDHLLKYGSGFLMSASGMSRKVAEAAILEHIRICYDICHFSLQYEDHIQSIKKITKEGIKIGKTQISAALKFRFDTNENELNEAFDCFSKLDERTYLHQLVQLNKDNSLTRFSDLPVALDKFRKENIDEWRVHFHVPLFAKKFGPLETTSEEVEDVLVYLEKNKITNHLEVETYTWQVMPNELKIDLAESISKELEWVKERMTITEDIR